MTFRLHTVYFRSCSQVNVCDKAFPFKFGDNQRPERTMTGVRKPPPESSVPGENLNQGSRRNQLRRGHGSPPVLSEVPHELSTVARSKECKRSPQQFIPAGFPLHDQFPRGRKTQTDSPTTPDMVRSGRVLQPQLNLHLNFDTHLQLMYNYYNSTGRHSQETERSTVS